MSDAFDAGNLYDVLGVSPEASDAEIGRAFRRLARRYHPDMTGGGGTGAGERFEEVSRAYQILGDPARRADYDHSRAGGSVPMSPRATRIPVRHASRASPTGASAPGRQRSAWDHPPVELRLSLREMLVGTTREVPVPADVPCGACGGTGRTPGGYCERCQGKGATSRSSGAITIRQICAACGGKGTRAPTSCGHCQGTGSVPAIRTRTVRVPAGVRAGTRLRIPGDSRSEPSLAAISIEENPVFTVSGDEITFLVPVTLAEAALGTSFVARSPTGATVQVDVPPGSASRARLTVNDPSLPAGLTLLAVVEIDVPTNLSDDQRRALEAFARATPSPRGRWPWGDGEG